MEEVLRKALLDDAAVSALVKTRVDWGIRPQGDALPGISLFVISDIPEQSYTHPTGWHRAQIQMESWGRSYLEARNLDRAARRVLDAFRVGEPGHKVRAFVRDRTTDSETVNGTVVHRSYRTVTVHYQST